MAGHQRPAGDILMTNSTERDRNEKLGDANSCIAIGASLGAVGIGYGVWKRFAANRECRGDAERKESKDGKIRS